ncbi:uncharacterized protein LOC105873614 [Microcebus murinus]|uniref:uncharacterized protein LOC105873614 n=1 Tax=Microcebus murinus TaxID=30608 RepID=UPI003F6D9BB3
MSGRQVSRSNTYSRLSHPNNMSFPTHAPGCAHATSLHRANSLKRPHAPSSSGSEFSSCSNHTEWSYKPSSQTLPLRRICMGQPYNSKWVESSHLMHPKVARKSSCRGSPHCLLCIDRPSRPSSPTFLEQLIRGIKYLDRSNATFCNSCPRPSLSLPRLAASCLERAADSFNLDHLDHPLPRCYSTPGASMATPADSTTSTYIVPAPRGAEALQSLGDSTNTSLPCSCRHLSPEPPRRAATKLPEIPLLSNGLFALGHLPKFWEAIRSGWSTPEPVDKPSSWW